MLKNVRASRSGGGKTVAKLLVRTLLASTSLLPCVALAQISNQSPTGLPPATYTPVDANGVDLSGGGLSQVFGSISIGDGEDGLSYSLSTTGSPEWGQIIYQPAPGGASSTPGTATLVIGGNSKQFKLTGSLASGSFAGKDGDPSTLVYNSGTSSFLYTIANGTEYVFNVDPVYTTYYYISSIRYASGVKKTYTYTPSGSKVVAGALISVSSNTGYQAHYDYVTSGGVSRLSKVTLFNTRVESCAPTASSCTLSASWPSFTFDTSGHATDQAGNVITFNYIPGNYHLSSVVSPAGRQVSYTWTATTQAGRIASATSGGTTWTYTWDNVPYVPSVTVSGPNGYSRRVYTELSSGRVVTDVENGVARVLGYAAGGQISELRRMDGTGGSAVYSDTFYTYDSRGNRIGTRKVSTVSGDPDITASATFPASCANPKTCNKPTSVTDERGKTTTYTYDETHGGVTTITSPTAPSGVAPQQRIGYVALTGSTGETIYKPDTVSMCVSSASCAGTADEVKQTVVYGAWNANNLAAQSVTVGAGDGSLSATTSTTYTGNGDAETVDGPLAGSADVERYRYDSSRHIVGVVGPDPDGAGPRKPRAVRTTYNPDGLPTKSEIGNVTDQSDAAWAGFSASIVADTGYDSAGRKTSERLSGGGTTEALTQYSYNAQGLVQCTAQRMNPAAFGSLPASACTLGTAGSFGSDRVTQMTYNANGSVTKLQTAYGTGEQSDEVTNTYSPDGKRVTVTDAENNRTTYEYDGYGRLSKTRYPVATKGAGASSSTDYEQLSYDAAGNIKSRRLRDNNAINYGYDDLNRLVTKHMPGLHVWEFDVTYTYDNMGRLTSAVDTNTHAVRFTYDALGRRLSEGSDHFGSKTFQYDIAGRRTRMTWRDGFYVDYDYDNANEMTAIRENGATSGVGVLATFAYDDLGRRTSLTRGNGTMTSYAYDSISRLASLTQDLGGTSYDFTNSLSYNPAGQIANVTHSNDTYAWNEHYNVDRGYVPNGLNQLTTAGSTALGYDGRGNLTSSGSSSYGYTSQNLLASAPGAQLGYDGLGRLYYNSAVDVWHDYDGGNLVGEIRATTNTINRRYVFGPGTDEPLVWYEGSGTSDRRWLHADERGSVVAVTDASGNVIANGINRYDEYGIPSSTNIGRFQYTGQAWLPEIGMYYYKARIYSPTLGRFMQTDPIGYGDGMNMYAYAGNDPVNFSDPTGLDGKCGDRGGPDDIVVQGGCGYDQLDIVPWWSNAPYVDLLGIGGGDMGSGSPMAGQVPQNTNQKKDPCAGSVRAEGVSVTGILGLGLTASFGKVTVIGSGASSWFFSVGFGAGADVGVSGFVTRYNNLSSFQGYAESYNGSGPLLRRTVGYSRSYDIDGIHTGDSLSGSGFPGLRAGFSGTATDTTLLGGQCTPH